MSAAATVTIAVSALNEAANMRAWLESVLRQNEEGFCIERILIISDGSTDDTVNIIRSFVETLPAGRQLRIEVREYKERRGKSARLNEIYRDLGSDIVVQSDADVVLEHASVVRDLIHPLLEDATVGMTGGRGVPLPARTFIEQAVNSTVEVYDVFQVSVRGGNNIFSAVGRLLAARKELVKSITVPADTTANDDYLYLSCLTFGYAYRYAPTAVIRFRSPQTLRDHVIQNTRFVAAESRMRRYFPADLVEREYAIPSAIYWKTVLGQVLRHPLRTSYIFLVNKYCSLRAALNRGNTALWEVAHTTKHV